MGLGVLEDRKLAQVPGTATLEALEGITRASDLEDASNLKRAKDGIIILVPQPSDDPDDPLNWPLWRRDMITFFLCLMSIIAATVSPLMAANTITLLTYYASHGVQVDVTGLALLTGYNLLGTAIGGFIVVPLARVWGKRWLILLGAVIIIISSIWCGLSGSNYNSLVAARFFQGMGLAPYEGLINAMVGELYFVHESGVRIALSNLCLFGGAFFTPVIVGKVTATINWQWTFYFVAIFCAAILPLIYLYCPETAYNRDDYQPKRRTSATPVQRVSTAGDRPGEKNGFSINEQPSYSLSHESSSSQERKSDGPESQREMFEMSTYPAPGASSGPLISRKNLRLFTGRKTHESFWKLALRPIPLVLQPAFFWAMTIQGLMIAWVAMLGVSLALLTLKLNFTEVETGYMYTGAFIGAIGAFAVAGLVSDPLVKWLTKKNNGIFEPEFRMVLVIGQVIFGIGGLFGFGVVSADAKYGWLLPDVFFGFVVAGMTFGAIVSAQYIVDGYRDLTIEGFTILVMFKNFIAYAITYKGFDWLAEEGSEGMFFMFAYIQIAVCALTIPMYIFGKRNRSFFTRYDVLEMLYLR